MPQDWLKDSWPTDAMPRDQLEARIERLLNMQNMGVLATTSKFGNPVATPIEFYPDGLALYMYPQPNSPKIENLRRNPKTCIAVHAPYTGWASARGAQVFGIAELIEKGQPGHEHGLKVFRWESSAAELQRPMDTPPEGIVLKITPTKIVYTEHWLRKDGFAPRQYWLAIDG